MGYIGNNIDKLLNSALYTGGIEQYDVLTSNDEQLIQKIYSVQAWSDGNPELSEDEAKNASFLIGECRDSFLGVSYVKRDCLEYNVSKQFNEMSPASEINKCNFKLSEAEIGNVYRIENPWIFGYIIYAVNSKGLRDHFLNTNYGNIAFDGINKLNSNYEMPIEYLNSFFDNCAERFYYTKFAVNAAGVKEYNGNENVTVILHVENIKRALKELLGKCSYKVLLAEIVNAPSINEETFQYMFEELEIPYIKSELIKEWATRQYDSSKIMSFADLDDNLDVVKSSFKMLSKYNERDVTEYLFDKIKYGSFRIQLLAKKALILSLDEDGVDVGVEELMSSDNKYLSMIGREIKGQRLLVKEKGRKYYENLLWSGSPDELFNPNPLTTTFFRHVEQFGWITSHIREKISSGKNENVSILSVGGSFGPEAYSVLMYLAHDFRKNPELWNNIDPLSKVTFYSTDIDELALEYAKEGRVSVHNCNDLSDLRAQDLNADLLGIDISDYSFEKYSCSPFKIKEEIISRLFAMRLDITNAKEVDAFVQMHGNPSIVLFNMVDGQLGELLIDGARNLKSLTSDLVITAPLTEQAVPILMQYLKLEETKNNSFLFKKQKMPK